MTSALMLAPTNERRTAVAILTVDVVDGAGREVAGQPITARFHLAGGTTSVATVVTDGAGRARFFDRYVTASEMVTVTSGRETTGPVPYAPGTVLTMEM